MFLRPENVVLDAKLSSVSFGINFAATSYGFFLYQEAFYHIFGESDGSTQLFHPEHPVEHGKPFVYFFKQGVQSGYFPVFGFKFLIVYSLNLAYLDCHAAPAYYQFLILQYLCLACQLPDANSRWFVPVFQFSILKKYPFSPELRKPRINPRNNADTDAADMPLASHDRPFPGTGTLPPRQHDSRQTAGKPAGSPPDRQLPNEPAPAAYPRRLPNKPHEICP